MDNRRTAGRSTETAYVPLETVLESIPDPVLLVDESHHIIDRNEPVGELFDCRPEAVLGNAWTDCCPTEDQEIFGGLVEDVPDTGGCKTPENLDPPWGRIFPRIYSHQYEERIDRFDNGDPIRIETLAGERRPVEVTVQRIYDGGDSFFFVSAGR